MRLRAIAFVVLLVGAALAPVARACADEPQAASGPLSASTLPQFLSGYGTQLDSADAVFRNLESLNLPLLDESGHPLERRSIKDRHQNVSDLRNTVKQLGANPQNLLLTLTLFDRSEKLSDELYDLSQIAYDNDQEELAGRLTELVTTLDHNQDLIESYALDLAATKEERLGKLESENRSLEAKLKEAETAKAKPSTPREP